MNCSSAQDFIFADRDTREGAAVDAALAEHLNQCAKCRALAETLTVATAQLREVDAAVSVPNPQTEWHAVRRRIRHADTSARPAGWLHPWRVALPAAFAAAVALVAWFNLPRSAPEQPATDIATASGPTAASARATAPAGMHDGWQSFDEHFAFTARAEFVETPDENASPFIYVDEESGWLVVWASDTAADASI